MTIEMLNSHAPEMTWLYLANCFSKNIYR